MKRLWGYLLVFLGAFLVVFAAVVKFAVAGPAVKAPLSIPEKYIKIIASGTDFNYFDAQVGKNVKINVWITRTVIGDVAAGNSKVAVYDESLCLTRDTDGSHPGCVDKADPQKRLITNSTDRVAFDRKSALAVNHKKYGENVDGNSAIKHEGLSYKFPIDTKKKTYSYFDTVVGKAFPMKYAAKEKLEGLTVYKFVQTMVDQPVYTNNTFPSTYTNTRTVWVEPTTGVIVKGQEQLKQVLTGRESLDPNSAVTEPGLADVVALQGTLAFNPDTVRLQAQLAKDNLPKIHLVRLWLPLISLIAGVLALGASVLLLRAPRSGGGRRRRSDQSDTPPQPDSPSPYSEASGIGPGHLFEGSGSGSSSST
jgi:Porin PorA